MNFRSKDFAPVDVDSGNEAAISRQNASLPFHSPALLSSWNLTIRYQCASPPASRQREWSTSRKGSSGEEGRTRRSSGSGVEGWNSKSVSIEKKDVPTLPHNSRIRRYPPPRSHSIRHLTSRMFTTKDGSADFCYASGGFNPVQGPRPQSKILPCSISQPVYPRKTNRPCHAQKSNCRSAAHLEHQRSTLGLLVTTIPSLALALICPPNPESGTYPSSKCLHLFNANCALVLHAVHSSLNTTFFVVLAFLWKTGFV